MRQPSRRAVAEMVLDDLREVADREVDPGDPDARRGGARSARGSGARRPAASAWERTRSAVAAHAPPAGHHDGPCLPGDRLEELVEQVQPDGPAGMVDDGDRADRAGPASAPAPRLVPPGHRPARTSRRQERGQRVVERRAGEQRPADVAVGHDADEHPTWSTASAIRRAPTVEREHRVAQRPAGRPDMRRRRRSRDVPGRCDRERRVRGRRRRSPPARTSASTTAPIPTVAPAPTSTWSRTAAPSPTGRRRR